MESNTEKTVKLSELKDFINQIPDIYNDFCVSKYEAFDEYGIFAGIIKIDINNKKIILPIK